MGIWWWSHSATSTMAAETVAAREETLPEPSELSTLPQTPTPAPTTHLTETLPTPPTPAEPAPRRKPRVLGAVLQAPEETDRATPAREGRIPTVPFFSQFTDITAPEWRKVGCGVASLGMLIEHYRPGVTTVDRLLEEGIAARAYLDHAGWIHAGLIELAQQHNLTGQSVSLSHLSRTAALESLTAVLREGPVMASVHYTFEPTNPIPHLVVVTGVKDGYVYYNDPAEAAGGGKIPIEKFQRAWKQRYIEIRPVT